MISMKWMCGLLNGLTLRTACGQYLICCLILYITVHLGDANKATHAEHVCHDIDIRNHVDRFDQLENCTVIEGFLRIVLIDHAKWSDYQKLRFPKLVEITDYLLIFRAYGLKRLSHIFPNLAVIRGQKVFVNYALVVFEVTDIEEIGLPSLTSIRRGAVRLEKNSNLCYINTINWDKITNVKSDNNFIMQNKENNECVDSCPVNCTAQVINEPTIHSQPLCWDYEHCQKVCPDTCGQEGCYPEKTSKETIKCCDRHCLGGCYGPAPTDCIACDRVFYQGRCQDNCPPGTYEYHERRCISAQECKDNYHKDIKTKWKLLDNGKCEAECPDGYTESKDDEHRCVKCVGPCPKVCGGLTIDSVAAAQKLRGCTVIHGILEIRIHGGNQVELELENSLGDIKEVRDYISISKSPALTSLGFFKSLQVIHGAALFSSSRYALFVLDNHNLVDIWDFKTHPNLTIETGKVFFHFNRKLCLHKIDKLVESVGLKDQLEEIDVSRQTNGDQVACNITTLKLEVVTVMETFAIIRWKSFLPEDSRKLLSWVVNYREAPEKNITVFSARDACGTDVWTTNDVRPDLEAEHVATIIHPLKAYTQYAVYVNTYTISTATTGAMSQIQYFRTQPGQPSPPRDIRVLHRKQQELHITWKPPREPNGNVTHYVITWQPIKLTTSNFERRNYCEYGLTKVRRDNTTQKQDKKEPEDPKKKDDKTDEKCCECKKKIDTPTEEERLYQIKFENALQNAIYRAHMGNHKNHEGVPDMTDFGSVTNGEDPAGSSIGGGEYGRFKKRKRDLRNEYNDNMLPSTKSPPPLLNVPPALTTDIDNYIGNSSSSLLNTSYVGNGSGYGSEEESQEDYSYAIVYGKTEIILPDLHHFQEYSIEVIACHQYEAGINVKDCSNRAIDAARTLSDASADIIQHANISVAKTIHPNGTIIRIRWPEPPDPNGLVVTYNLEMKRIGIDNLKQDEYCITHKHYRTHGGFAAQGLAPGKWSFRIRATSLAGFGPWTPFQDFKVEDDSESILPIGLIIGFVSVSFLMLVALLLCLACYIKRKRDLPDPAALYTSINPDYWGTGDVYVPDEWEVDRDKVELIKELGNGSFGMVYEGIAKNLNDIPKQKVAVKTVTENASIKDRIEFLNEASVMKAFTCHHVVKLIGVVSKGQPTLVVMELMSNGDLKTFLRMHRPDYEGNEKRKPPTLVRILQMAGEIADGMSYLSASKFVHRDLAARNCMVAEDFTVKIGDFGMTRDIYETDYYRKGGKGLLPVRWMAPESLRDGVFSSQSDVWSYGVVLWEMSTLAAQPYQGLANEQVLKFVVDGKIMEMPEHCPDRLYTLMQSCWKYQPSKRPTFNEIIAQLVPDLTECFRHNSFFFSELNKEHDDPEENNVTDLDDYEEGVNSPLTGSPRRQTDLHHEDSNSYDENLGHSAAVTDAALHLGNLDSSHSTLSYDSHLRHSPSSSPHNQNCYLANNIEAIGDPHLNRKADGVGEPCDCENTVHKDTNKSDRQQYHPPSSYMLRQQSEIPSQKNWSPEKNPMPHSNEGSKGSSKSSTSSNGLNGISNGHIPRIIVPNPQC